MKLISTNYVDSILKFDPFLLELLNQLDLLNYLPYTMRTDSFISEDKIHLIRGQDNQIESALTFHISFVKYCSLVRGKIVVSILHLHVLGSFAFFLVA